MLKRNELLDFSCVFVSILEQKARNCKFICARFSKTTSSPTELTFKRRRIPYFSLFLWSGCLSGFGNNEQVHITLCLRHINALPLINPITQLSLPADLTFKMTQTVASHMVDAAQVLLRER